MSKEGEQRATTLRRQLLFVVILGAVLPFSLVGLWLTASGLRSGQALLHRQLSESADEFAAIVQRRWQYRQGDLLLVADNDVARRAADGVASRADIEYLNQVMEQIQQTIPSMEIRSAAGSVHWSSTPASRRTAGNENVQAVVFGDRTVPVTLPILDGSGATLGSVVAQMKVSGLMPPDSARPLIPGSRVAMRQTGTDRVLISLDPSAPFDTTPQLTIRGARWLAVARTVHEPMLDFVVAAPLSPYVQPFRTAALVGMSAIGVVTAIALAVIITLTGRIVRPLQELVDAAEGVTRGELEQRVEADGPVEVRRLGAAFNAMTTSLRETLDALSERNSMAAVGEFAAALSHDIRNALTSIKVDLERSLHRRGDEQRTRALVERALHGVARLESLVGGALRVGRGHHATFTTVDLRAPIAAALDSVEGLIAAVPARIGLDLSDASVDVTGDAIALEQLFANLLFNASQALRPGGEIHVAMRSDMREHVVSISDDGVGMDATQVRALDQPFFSSKRHGTGLGLPIARRIAAAHAGRVTISSVPSRGTKVEVWLPRAGTIGLPTVGS